jgi:hypothetical protein
LCEVTGQPKALLNRMGVIDAGVSVADSYDDALALSAATK